MTGGRQAGSSPSIGVVSRPLKGAGRGVGGFSGGDKPRWFQGDDDRLIFSLSTVRMGAKGRPGASQPITRWPRTKAVPPPLNPSHPAALRPICFAETLLSRDEEAGNFEGSGYDSSPGSTLGSEQSFPASLAPNPGTVDRKRGRIAPFLF